MARRPKRKGGDFSAPRIAIGVAAYRPLPPRLLPLLPMFELPLLLPCCPRDVPD
jgi:hypothetical protein